MSPMIFAILGVASVWIFVVYIVLEEKSRNQRDKWRKRTAELEPWRASRNGHLNGACRKEDK